MLGVKMSSTKNVSFLRSLINSVIALIIGAVIAVALAEVITRFAMPIFPGMHKLNAEGEPVTFHNVAPNSVYRQFSAEFDAHTTINKDGYRIPDAKDKNPDVVFIGDSFTYGQGLSDDETFVMKYCTQAKLSCMNLGVPGYGTIDAVERLETFLTEKQVHPRKVYLVMLAMTSFLGAGNDLYDNIKTVEARNDPQKNEHEESESTLRKAANKILQHSNFARVIKFYFAPMIKKAFVVAPEENLLQEGLVLTKQQLDKLQALSKTHNFEFEVVLIHPVQDISRGSHQETFKAIQAISPVKVIPTAKFFEPDPSDYYFSMDGHFNKAGSDKMVELFLSID